MPGSALVVLSVRGCNKKKYESDADLADIYGILPRGGYEARFGLWLNRHRVGAARAYWTHRGVIWGMTRKVDMVGWQAVCDSEDQAKLNHWRQG